MFVHTQCRSCGGPLLLGSGATRRSPARIGWWLDADLWHDGCKPKLTPRDNVDRELRHALRQLERVCTSKNPAITDELVGKWEARCRELEAQLAEFDKAPPRLGEAAVLYAQWGWPVFPIVEGTKRPANRNGFQGAHTDVEKIRAYWQRNPMANIGIATGHMFDVIDVDVPKEKNGELTPDGREIFAKLLEQVNPADGKGPLPDCYGINKTPTGGIHILVAKTGAGNRGGLFPGIDTRGIGGYIVAPPSQRPEGRYRWEVPPAPKMRRRG